MRLKFAESLNFAKFLVIFVRIYIYSPLITQRIQFMQKSSFSSPSPSRRKSSDPIHSDSLARILPWLFLLFAYAWWAVIIVYYGLLDASISVGYQFQSFPIVIVSLALVQILKLSMQKKNHLLSALLGFGLFVSGLLA